MLVTGTTSVTLQSCACPPTIALRRVVGRPGGQHPVPCPDLSVRCPRPLAAMFLPGLPCLGHAGVHFVRCSGEIGDCTRVTLDVIRQCPVHGAWTVSLLVATISVFLLSQPHLLLDHGDDLSWHRQSCHGMVLDVKLTCGDPRELASRPRARRAILLMLFGSPTPSQAWQRFLERCETVVVTRQPDHMVTSSMHGRW